MRWQTKPSPSSFPAKSLQLLVAEAIFPVATADQRPRRKNGG
jgi:hypothetical protein